MTVGSFHLVRLPTLAAAAQVARVPTDRRALRTVTGLRFGKLLGTGSGQRMALSADLRRWAMFGVWDDDDALHRFLTTHPLSLRWDDAGAERFDVRLDPIGARGSWDGIDPLGGAVPAVGAAPAGPLAVITRATVRWPKVPAFVRAVPAADARLAGAEGLVAAVGIGEAPVARQATFSLWRDLASMRGYAQGTVEHRTVVRRTRDEDWYGEEWFARFRPRDWSGTWDGVRPLG